MSEAAVIEPVEARRQPPPAPGTARASSALAGAPPAAGAFSGPRVSEQAVCSADTPPPGEGAGPYRRGRVCSPNPAGSLLVLGLGNDILTDDAIGLRLVRALAGRLEPSDRAVVIESEEMGLSLLDHIVGYDELVIVDAIQTGTAVPGHLHQFEGHALPSRRTGAPHFLGVGDTLALGRLMDLPMPSQVKILAVEVADPLTLGTELTPQLQSAFPGLLERLLAVVRGTVHPQSLGIGARTATSAV